MIKVIIAGGRDFSDYPLLRDKCNFYLQNYLKFDKKEYNYNPYIEIVSGGAKGADSLGEIYATNNLIKIKKFIPDWDKHGKAGGHIRNRQMGDYATNLVAFWNDKSKGTKGMVDYMTKLKKPFRVVRY